MRKFTYLLFILFTITSCEKDYLETEALELENKLETSDSRESVDFFTVIGENDPLVDIDAVQYAVDNYDRVMLSGIFDFGTWDQPTFGGIYITRPNIIFKGPAIINNGNYALTIRAPGVVIHGIEFNNPRIAIFVSVLEGEKPVIIEDNIINARGGAVASVTTICGIKVINNRLEGNWCYFDFGTTGTTEVLNNDMIGIYHCIRVDSANNKMNIEDNVISVGGYSESVGIWINAWSVSGESDPEWGDNPPVRIVDNLIDIEGGEILNYATGIMLGTSAAGINNVMVKGNTLTGEAGYGGLVKQPYGHNNKFIDNDLTGLMTYGPQIWLMGGRNNFFLDNKLGVVEPFSIGVSGWDAATLVSSINWHRNDFYNTPDPVNFDNHFNGNDYSLTGVHGWTDNQEGSFGSVLLFDFIQQFSNTGSYEEPFVMENFVAEELFPAGTDLCTQVLDLSNLQGDDLVQGNNHIAGWTACEANVNKQTYEIVRNRYKNLGQYLKNTKSNREDRLIDRRY